MESSLKRLRIKIVATVAAISFAVLAVAFVTVCAISYSQDTSSVYQALESAIMRDAASAQHNEARALEGVLQPDMRARNDFGGRPDFDGYGKQFEIGGRRDVKFIPVAVFQLTAAGGLTPVSRATTGSLSEEAYSTAAMSAPGLQLGRGFLASSNIYYLKQAVGGDTYVAFADGDSASEWKALALRLLAVGVLAFAVFLALALVLSKWALRPVEESWRRQQQFVADASHELKTPLTVMAANASILARHPEKTIASQSQWVESMQSEIECMQELVGDMLTLASADADAEQEAASEPVNLSKVVGSHLLQFESLAYERGIDVESDIEGGIWVEGSPERVSRMVGTLLDNAYKYAGPGGRVCVALSSGQRGKVLEVANSGATIPPEDLPHIFDRFYRADKSRGRDANRSFGLGLAIAKETADAMGAKMTASSADGRTTFTVTFPA